MIDPSWYIDSGAIDHITSDLNNLDIHRDYKGKAQVTIDNGSHLPITHIGDSVISNCNSSLLLNDILHVPQISKSLLSVSKFIKDNNVLAEFHSDSYFIRHKLTK